MRRKPHVIHYREDAEDVALYYRSYSSPPVRCGNVGAFKETNDWDRVTCRRCLQHRNKKEVLLRVTIAK